MTEVIRDATPKDVRRIWEIYSYYVENTAITFEYTVPSFTEFQKRMEKTMKKYPCVVVEENGVVQGYTYVNALKERPAYDWACETSIYIDKSSLKKGYGRKLYEALENKLKNIGMLNLYALIAYPNDDTKYVSKNSVEFHTRLGYKKIGEYHNCGYKFESWFNVVHMEKIIGEHKQIQPKVDFLNE